MTLQHDSREVFIQTATLVRIGHDGASVADAKPSTLQLIFELVRQWLGVIIVVILPTIVTIVYCGFIQSDRYISEAKFVVRGPSSGAMGQLASALQGTGIVRSADDAYVVHAFMESRDALDQLVRNSSLLDILSRPEADFLSTYPPRWSSVDRESLFKKYLSMVYVDFNATTGISLLRVQAYRPGDAQDLANALITNAEVLVNRMNDRAQQDAITAAMQEIEISKDRALAAQAKVTEFRKRESLIDPTLQSKSTLEAITKLSVEVAQSSAQLTELARSSPQSPQISNVKTRIEALQGEIEKQRLQLGGSTGALAPKIAEYERLMLETEFAARSFVSAMNSLESARLDARRQKMYLDRVAEPSRPDHPGYPSRLLNIIMVAAIGLLIYKICILLVTDTKGHSVR